ncbi:ABC transporter ATP-binding protein/permease [uncultured Aquimarina sp.]|uniref:ATP-binding cassette domain-containing protein n=1 Tax=uncultured Aquimarina sp. TaxID=575652 RepID=UPI00260C7ACC|nr:ABC transporter ATP-binding protein/permease [uncultured Aquimarina sp.]
MSFLNLIKRIQRVIPKEYRKTSKYFSLLSFFSLILDAFSIFLLIPVIISILGQEHSFDFLNVTIETNTRYVLLGVVILFFVAKNYIAIEINKYRAKKAFELGSEYSSLLSKFYLLENYVAFKQEKKSTVAKDIIFVPNDFVSNVLLSLNTILSELLLLFILCLIGVFFNYITTLLIIMIMVVIFLVHKKYNSADLEKINKTRINDYNQNISNLNNLLNGYLSLKSSNISAYFLNAFHNSNKALNESYAILHAKRVNSTKQTEIILILILCVIFMITNVLITDKTNATVFLSVFAALLFKAIPSLNKLNIAFTNFKAHLYTLDIIEKKTNISKDKRTANAIISFEKEISLQDISFYYDQDKKILDNLNLKFSKGKFTAISGNSGVGKTTLLNVISKLIKPTSGNIYIDDIKITEENKYEYFNLFTYLTQKPFIYEGTILENIVLNKTDYNKEELNGLISDLKIDKIINQFPDGIHTFIGSDAGNLSGGQLQLICIARAIINNPEILILDEATNNLDKEAEIRTLSFLKTYASKNNCTIITVSHHIDETKNMYDSIIELKK